jgi:hypothetical protein
MTRNVTLYGYYWVSYFIGIIVWAATCMALRARSNEYPMASIKLVALGWSVVGATFLGLLPVMTGISWFWPLVLFVPFYLLLQLAGLRYAQGPHKPREVLLRLIGLRQPPPRPEYYQLLHTASFFWAAFAFAAIGFLTSHPLWYIGASILTAASIWNAYSEYHVKEAIHQLHSNVSDEILWSGPLLPEEAPSIFSLLIAPLFFPLTVGIVDAARFREIYRLGIGPLLVFFFLLLVIAASSAAFIPNDQKKTAVGRIYAGAAILVGACCMAATIAYFLPIADFDLRHATLIPLSGAGSPGSLGHMELVGICLWAGALTLLLAVIGAVLSSIAILLKPPEYQVFVSFSTEDREEANAFAQLVRDHKLKEFYSDEAVLAGDQFRDQILKAIRNSMDVAVICSPSSSKRPWVVHEVSSADAIGKRIVAILLNVRLEDLKQEPIWEIIRKFSAIEYSKAGDYVKDLKRRSSRRGHHDKPWAKRGGS